MKALTRILLAALLVLTGAFSITLPAHAEDNLIPNPSVEVVSPDPTLPDSWQTGYLWGDLDANYQYLNTGYQSNHSVKVTVSRYASGDAKWYFAPVAVAASQVYKFTDSYFASTPTSVIAAVTKTDNSVQYIGLPNAPAVGSWTNYSADFATPAGAASLSIYHLISAVGSLTTDNFSLTAETVNPNFNRGLVSLTFDDGWWSQYLNGTPVLNQYGYKATYYIITGVVGQPEYMTLNQVKALNQAGHEIGSHTVHHYDLTTLSLKQLNAEFSQSKSYLQNKIGKSITSFAYPYGAYNSQTDQRVKIYYQSARSSDEGLNSKANFNAYNIRSEHITPQTTIAQFQAWIDEARDQKEWLVLMYHQVDTSGSEYSVTPAMFTSQLQTVQTSGLTVKTANQALIELKAQL